MRRALSRETFIYGYKDAKTGEAISDQAAGALPLAPDNPTECDMVFKDGAWRIWCEADLAGPCKGCPEAVTDTPPAESSQVERCPICRKPFPDEYGASRVHIPCFFRWLWRRIRGH